MFLKKMDFLHISYQKVEYFSIFTLKTLQSRNMVQNSEEIKNPNYSFLGKTVTRRVAIRSQKLEYHRIKGECKAVFQKLNVKTLLFYITIMKNFKKLDRTSYSVSHKTILFINQNAK
ncbi:hypothetical protein CW304_14705 [Bacillus sp. UFRGS-B20]|nr:hypothetical protein CW304_14705 [Bacillus sp. UFRGS-B20]